MFLFFTRQTEYRSKCATQATGLMSEESFFGFRHGQGLYRQNTRSASGAHPACYSVGTGDSLAQSVQRIATGRTVRGSNPSGGEIFRTRPDQPWSPPSLLHNWYSVSFPGVKRPGRGVDHSTPSSAKVKEIVLLLPFWAYVTCSRVNFTFTFTCTVDSFTGGKKAGMRRCPFVKSCAELKNEYSYTSILPYALLLCAGINLWVFHNIKQMRQNWSFCVIPPDD